jgi:hypothetical protein
MFQCFELKSAMLDLIVECAEREQDPEAAFGPATERRGERDAGVDDDERDSADPRAPVRIRIR